MKQQVKPIRLGEVIRKWRHMSELGQRGAAKQIGISAATLCRLETGETAPDAHTFIRILQWLLEEIE